MNPPKNHAEMKKSRKPFVFGCLGGGCLAFVLVLTGFSLYWLNWVKSVPEDAPTVEPVTFDQEKFENLGRRYETFRNKVERGDTNEFVLTEEDVNVCLSKWAKEKSDAALATIALDGENAMGRASIPITMEDKSKKWVNCEFNVGVGVKDGQLDLQILELKVKDKTFGNKGVFAKPINELKDDAIQKFQEDPNVRKQMDNIDSIFIKNGQIHVRVKPNAKLDAIPQTK